MEASVWTWSMLIPWVFFSFHCTTSDDNCTNHFTPNQVARMHCYLDLVYQKWLTDRQPAPIPLAPIVTDQSPNSVSIYWLPSIRGPLYQRYSGFLILLIIEFLKEICLHLSSDLKNNSTFSWPQLQTKNAKLLCSNTFLILLNPTEPKGATIRLMQYMIRK